VEGLPVIRGVIWTGGAVLVVFFFAAGRLRRNRWSGIRCAYTLADDEVWRRVHGRFRWAFLGLGAFCLLYPIDGFHALMIFTSILLAFLLGFTVASYLYARRVYERKFGTRAVVSRGFFRYAPPDGAGGTKGGAGEGRGDGS
jgi:hypothetical protein